MAPALRMTRSVCSTSTPSLPTSTNRHLQIKEKLPFFLLFNLAPYQISQSPAFEFGPTRLFALRFAPRTAFFLFQGPRNIKTPQQPCSRSPHTTCTAQSESLQPLLSRLRRRKIKSKCHPWCRAHANEAPLRGGRQRRTRLRSMPAGIDYDDRMLVC
jgi:hypothetical protein